MSKIFKSLEALQQSVQTVSGLERKTLICYDPEDLKRHLVATPSPAVGIVYEGASAQVEPGTGRIGLATSATFGVYLAMDTSIVAGGRNVQFRAHELLDAVRSVLLDTRGPASHSWRFVVEALVESGKDRVIWVQRWDTPIVFNR